MGDIYRELTLRTGEEWRNSYLQSEEFKRYIQLQIASSPPAAESRRGADRIGIAF